MTRTLEKKGPDSYEHIDFQKSNNTEIPWTI